MLQQLLSMYFTVQLKIHNNYCLQEKLISSFFEIDFEIKTRKIVVNNKNYYYNKIYKIKEM